MYLQYKLLSLVEAEFSMRRFWKTVNVQSNPDGMCWPHGTSHSLAQAISL